MAKKYKLITPEDRRAIEKAYFEGESVAVIADEIGASRASVYREIARGYTGDVDKNGRPAYSAAVAQAATTESMSRRGRPFAR